ncbi:MAG: DUF5063 domain-containing protein [Sporolactobacillus sp.]
MKDRANSFYKTAESFYKFVDSLEKCNSDSVYEDLLKKLLSVYREGLYLPQVDFDTDIKYPKSRKILCPKIDIMKYDTYWEVFNSYHFEQPIQGSLVDDIKNIYIELKKGEYYYQRQQFSEAIWQWKFGFETHWGLHAIEAIRALHSLVYIELYLKDEM